MSGMEFGIFEPCTASENEYFTDLGGLYEEHLQRGQLADELGYDYFFSIERQNSPAGQIASPNVFLSALAQRTKQLRFGMLIHQVPLHHPFLLAEEIAFVDQLSGGRMQAGIGSGISEHEFTRLNVDFQTKTAKTHEALELMIRLWTEDIVTFDGEFFKLNEAIPVPHPFQKPHPPIWIAAHSHRSFDLAAKHNYNVAQSLEGDDATAAKFAYFREKLAEYDHPGPPPKMLLVRHLYVAETDEQARKQAERHLLMGYFSGGETLLRTSLGFGSQALDEARPGEDPKFAKTRGEIFEMTTKSYDYWLDTGLAIVGSPETVANRIAHLRETMGINAFCGQHRFGKLSPKLARNSMRLFAEDVMPKFR
jgi:alkanesulfonate monooxygenase SsuD/methylene tetrahydromethanopterin reductase-like flavin-dependent oxidoreductase (luciferase family)